MFCRKHEEQRRRVGSRQVENPASSISTWGMRVYESKGWRIRIAFERRWKDWHDDRAANGNANLDRSGYHRPTPWIHWIECHHTNGTGTESVFWTRVRFPRTPRGFD